MEIGTVFLSKENMHRPTTRVVENMHRPEEGSLSGPGIQNLVMGGPV